MTSSPVTAFISYSWDDEAHKHRVLGLAQMLRVLGIDVRLDQFEQQKHDLPGWMANEIRTAGFILVIGSPGYKRSLEQGTPASGLGAQWEGMLITSQMYSQAGVDRIVPVYLPPAKRTDALPDYLTSSLNYDVDVPADWSPLVELVNTELLDRVSGLESLYRRLTNQPAVSPQPVGPVVELGSSPETPPTSAPSSTQQSDGATAAIPVQEPPVLTGRDDGNTSVFEHFGLVDIFDGRSVRIREEYEDRTRAAVHGLDIMGFGLRAFREDFQQSIPELARQIPVRLLVIDPVPDDDGSLIGLAEMRDAEEGNPLGSIRRDVADLLEAFRDAALSSQGRLQIRLYSCLPMLNVYRVDDELFWGPYVIGQQSRNSPTFLVRRGGILWDRITGHFNSVWSSDTWSRDAF